MAKRGKVRPSISSDPVPAPKRAALIGAPAASAAPVAPPRDWKAEPDLRAFACLLSWEAGWTTEPDAIAWTFEETSKVVEVKRPEGSESSYSAARGTSELKAEMILVDVRRRWGHVVFEKIAKYVWPMKGDGGIENPIGPRAFYLRQLAARAAAGGATATQIEIALVDLLRTCVSIVRGANLGDPNPSAATTRAVASGALLEMINPAPPSV